MCQCSINHGWMVQLAVLLPISMESLCYSLWPTIIDRLYLISMEDYLEICEMSSCVNTYFIVNRKYFLNVFQPLIMQMCTTPWTSGTTKLGVTEGNSFDSRTVCLCCMYNCNLKLYVASTWNLHMIFNHVLFCCFFQGEWCADHSYQNLFP